MYISCIKHAYMNKTMDFMHKTVSNWNYSQFAQTGVLLTTKRAKNTPKGISRLTSTLT